MNLQSLPRVFLLVSLVAPAIAPAADVDPATPASVRQFIGAGFGQLDDAAPVELQQFGQLAGIWTTEAQIRNQDGSWTDSAPGMWAWKYSLGGFAVSDLFFHSADTLPEYLGDLGREYMVAANRIFDLESGNWQIAWMANGAGQAAGSDFGTFTAKYYGDRIIMLSPPGDGPFGHQRIVFHDISDDKFNWTSEYSQDNGKTWTAVMNIQAIRIR